MYASVAGPLYGLVVLLMLQKMLQVEGVVFDSDCSDVLLC